MARIVWKGQQVRERVARAAQLGVERTMSQGVSHAKRDHPWEPDTGFEEAAIRMGAATVEADRIVGHWGAYTNYSLFLEIGTSRIGADATEREDAGGGNMWQIPSPQPSEGVTVSQDFTILPPGSMTGQEGFVTLHAPSSGTGPLMAPRPFLRPAADREYPLLAERIGQAFRGEEMT